MVPKGFERLASKGLCHDLRHAHRQSRGATGSVEDSVFAYVDCGLIDRFGVITQPQLLITSAAL